jgi:hypothetical protein
MTRDWLADSGHEIPARCPSCYPAEDPMSYVVAWCGDHRPSVAGPDDEKMLGLYNALIHMGEAGGPDNRAVCEQIHRPKDTDT